MLSLVNSRTNEPKQRDLISSLGYAPWIPGNSVGSPQQCGKRQKVETLALQVRRIERKGPT